MQLYTVYLYLETALHVSGGTSTNHQEHINYIYSIWYLSHRYCYLPLSRRSWKRFEWQIPDAIDTIVCAPDDRWRYHPKHVEQFPDINKLCKVAFCWIYIGIYLRCTDLWTLNSWTPGVKYTCQRKTPWKSDTVFQSVILHLLEYSPKFFFFLVKCT